MSRAAVVLCVAALALSGCGGKDEPTKSPTPTPTASSNSPSPSASASSASPSASASARSAVPAAARERTEAGAIAFLKFYFDLLNTGLVDPANPPDLFAYSDKGCVACKRSQEHVSEYAQGGWSVKQSGIRIDNAALATKVTAPSVIINFTFVEMEQPLYQNGKKTNHNVPAANTKKGAALKWVNGAWQMYGVENL